MATKHEKEVLAETLKREGTTRTFTWMDWTNKKQLELRQFKEMLEEDWDSNSEKVYKKREEEYKKQLAQVEDFIRFMFPEDGNKSWRMDYDVTIMITQTK